MNVDSSVRNLTTQERRKIVRNDIKNNIIPGTLIGVGMVGTNAFIKKNRGDTFISTMKNCAKYEAKSSRETLAGFLKLIKLEKAGNYIEKIGNKKMFAIAFAGNIALGTILSAAVKGSSK